jgi:hypothetical protein
VITSNSSKEEEYRGKEERKGGSKVGWVGGHNTHLKCLISLIMGVFQHLDA